MDNFFCGGFFGQMDNEMLFTLGFNTKLLHCAKMPPFGTRV